MMQAKKKNQWQLNVRIRRKKLRMLLLLIMLLTWWRSFTWNFISSPSLINVGSVSLRWSATKVNCFSAQTRVENQAQAQLSSSVWFQYLII